MASSIGNKHVFVSQVSEKTCIYKMKVHYDSLVYVYTILVLNLLNGPIVLAITICETVRSVQIPLLDSSVGTAPDKGFRVPRVRILVC